METLQLEWFSTLPMICPKAESFWLPLHVAQAPIPSPDCLSSAPHLLGQPKIESEDEAQIISRQVYTKVT
jgi:hypothetical protein